MSVLVRRTPQAVALMARNETTAGAGNTLAVKHGAQSPRIVAARTQAIVDEWLGEDGLRLSAVEPQDTAAVYATAAAYARLCELTEYLEGLDEKGNSRGALDSRGRPRGAMRLYFTAYREVMAGLRQLGATPGGRAEMLAGAGAAHGLASQLAAAARRREIEGKR